MKQAKRVEIFEVGPRDGLQNEPGDIALADKIALVNLLSSAGFRRIEAGSFVDPRWVPQMADSASVFQSIARAPDVVYVALTPNLRGFHDAIAAGADEVAVFASASDGFSRANINATIAESFERFAPVFEAAKSVGVRVRGYVSCVVECPYDGPIAPQSAAAVVRRLLDMGCYEVSLGDTLGRATPEQTDAMLKSVLDAAPVASLAGHFHDTSGRALENIAVSLERGLRVFDASIGGLGGCPYAPGAAGNVATEKVYKYLTENGFETGLDESALSAAGQYVETQLFKGERTHV